MKKKKEKYYVYHRCSIEEIGTIGGFYPNKKLYVGAIFKNKGDLINAINLSSLNGKDI